MISIERVRDRLAHLISHVTFEYNGKCCGVDPLSRNKFDMWYGDKYLTADSIGAVMEVKLFDGKSLQEIWDDIVDLEL